MKKIKIPSKDIKYLRENYPKMGRQDIADNLGWSLNHLVYIAKILHLHQSPEFLSKSRRERFRPHLNAEEEQHFRDNYPSTTNKVLSERYGVSMCIIKNMAKERGLRKSAEHIRECCLRALENGRTTNIINGWPPKGYRVPNGGFKKGVTNIMRLGPEKDAERIRKISEGRKRGIKKERARILFGLSQKTQMRLVCQPKKKLYQKCYLRKRGYYIDDEERVAYYDVNTKRSKRIEALAEFYDFLNVNEKEEVEI